MGYPVRCVFKALTLLVFKQGYIFRILIIPGALDNKVANIIFLYFYLDCVPFLADQLDGSLLVLQLIASFHHPLLKKSLERLLCPRQ